MSGIIISALALALFQYWLLPSSTKLKHAAYLLGTRDEPLELTIMQKRIARAGDNLKESMVPFLVLCLLSMHKDVDVIQVAQIWLGLRVAYIPCYMFGINPVRTLVWTGSLACLIYMAYLLV